MLAGQGVMMVEKRGLSRGFEVPVWGKFTLEVAG
jgi:hypothetical protein